MALIYTANCDDFLIWWFVRIYSFHTSPKYVDGMPALSRANQIETILRHLPDVIRQSYGNFGWLDTPTPKFALSLAAVFAIIFLVPQWRSASSAIRLWVVATIAITELFGIVIELQGYSMFRSFSLQGRHIVPLLVGVTIVLFARVDWRTNRDRWVASVWAILMIWC